MFASLRRFGVSFLVVTMLGPLLGQPANAVTVTLLPSSTLANGTAVISIGSPSGTKCDVAVGSEPGKPDYKWFQNIDCTQAVVTNIPAVAQVYVRVWAGGAGQDFILRATTPIPAPPTSKPAYPNFLSPASKAKLTGPSARITWTDVKPDKYVVTVGSSGGAANYGAYTTNDTALTIENLPQSNKTV